MEFDENLGILSKKAWDLVDKISDEIQSDQSISFCRHCSEHGVYCGIAQTPLMLEEEREKLIAIRDSIKDVETMLVFLQRLQSYQQQHCHAAISRLDESRLHLIEKIQQHFQQNGRKLDVIEELDACFGDEKMEKKIELKVNNRKSWPFVNCIRSLFNPLNWHNTAKIAIKLIVVSFTISSTCRFLYQSRQEYENFRRKCVSSPDSSVVGKREFFASDLDDPLDVSYGMG